jgi:hypothetical protein
LLYVQPLVARRSTTQAMLDRGAPHAGKIVILRNLWVFKDSCTSTQYYGNFNAKIRQHQCTPYCQLLKFAQGEKANTPGTLS